MRIKAVVVILISSAIFAACFVTFTIITHLNGKKESQSITGREPTIALNDVIASAMMVYVTSPYQRYSRDELYKYFTRDIADGILKSYETVSDPNEETVIEFKEQPFPEIRDIEIQFDNGEYQVKLLFGEVYYNYRLIVTPNQIITGITDGGITFD